MKARLAVGVTAVAVAALAWRATRGLRARPVLPSDRRLYTTDDGAPSSGEPRAMFMGVSSIAFTDGHTTIVVDGFFSRPSLLATATRALRPNEAAIDFGLQRAGLTHADIVLVAHSHYDHLLDSPTVARRLGAKLVGSESTLVVGRAEGLDEHRLHRIDVDRPIQVGRFTVTAIESEHAPDGKFPGVISSPFHLPARVGGYRMAECFAFHITHTDDNGRVRRTVVNASAGFRDGMFEGIEADSVFLGVGTLAHQSLDYRNRYWDQAVASLDPETIYPIHWDDFTKGVQEPLTPLPYAADDFSATISDMVRRCAAERRFLIPGRWSWLEIG